MVKWRKQSALERALPVAALVALVTFVPAGWLAPDRFTAYATALQSFGVLLALALAARTLLTELKDRRLDRVIALHTILMEGEIGQARYRFIRHLRSNRDAHGRIPRITRDDLMEGQPLAEYPGHYADLFKGHNPRQDANQVIRHFERVDTTRLVSSVDEDMLFRLLGPQVVWWDNALRWEPGRNGTWGIHRMSQWAQDYADRHPELDLPWGEWEWDILNDFGRPPGLRLPD